VTEALIVAPIVLEVETLVGPERAWRAVTDPADVAEWFADVTPADGIGSPYRIDFGDGSAVEGRIRAFEPGRRLAYTWAWAGDPAGPTTLVTWEVERVDRDGARVRLTHDGWAEAGADQDTRDDHADYWESYLEALEAMLAGEAHEGPAA
jgi:uncharacterized protein YndB with AHSA1/START domain